MLAIEMVSMDWYKHCRRSCLANVCLATGENDVVADVVVVVDGVGVVGAAVAIAGVASVVAAVVGVGVRGVSDGQRPT